MDDIVYEICSSLVLEVVFLLKKTTWLNDIIFSHSYDLGGTRKVFAARQEGVSWQHTPVHICLRGTNAGLFGCRCWQLEWNCFNAN